MSTICVDHQHKLFHSHQLFSSNKINNNKPFKDLGIPPRKLLTKKPQQDIITTMSPHDISPYEACLRKYLPYNHHNNGDGNDVVGKDFGGNIVVDDDEDEVDPYSSDDFRMYEFKVRRCSRSRSHDWTDCPFAHPGEKARRRDPRRFHYSGTACPEFRRGGCSKGDNCELSHGVFECWLHPSRYRTEACKDGRNCKRKVCFFAHSPRELRVLPEVVSCGGGGGSRKRDMSLVSSCDSSSLNHGHCCCLFSHSLASSPTSSLPGVSHVSPPLSPSLSPPLSPVKQRSLSGFSPISRYSDRLSKLGSGVMSYKDVLNELISSLEAMNVAHEAASANNRDLSSDLWIDCNNSFNGGGGDHHHHHHQQQQFILSPSTPSPSGGSGNFFKGDYCSNKAFIDYNNKIHDNNNGGGGLDPDLGWVNELLM